MAKSDYYSVELIHSENREETIINRSFENNSNIILIRDQAFSYFKELFLAFEDEFLYKESVIPIKLTICFNAVSQGRDLDYGQVIIFDRIHTSPMYILTLGKLEERGHFEEVEFIKKLPSDSEILNATDIAKNIALRTGESSVISFIRKSLSERDPKMNEVTKSSYQLIECSRCGKKMEVEHKVANLFYQQLNMSHKVIMVCTTCIETKFNVPKPSFSLESIYDKEGKSVYKGDRNLTY